MADKKTGATSRRDVLLLVLATLFMGATIGGFVYFQKVSNENSTWLTLAKQLSSDVTTISAVGRDATRGIDPDFGTLEALATAFDENIKALAEGDPGNQIVAAPAATRENLDGVATAWKTMKAAVDAMVQNETAYSNTRDNIGQLSERIDSVMEGPINPVQEAQLQRMKVAAAEVLSAGRDAASTATRLHAMAKGYAGGSGPGLREVTEQIIADAPAVTTLQQNAAVLQGEALNVIANAKTFEQSLIDYAAKFRVLPIAVISAGGLALISLAGFIALFLLTARRQVKISSDEARVAAEKDQLQQEAILNLLNDIGTLADGDLTVNAKVTTDFTGAIADSINYAIDAMRGLVGTINNTSTEVATAASGTADTARKMNEASERQAKEVGNITAAIVASSQQLQQMATRAEQLAGEAQKSVQTAHSGADTVSRAIQGMTALREQIQDTSKRIKRLGESSQEIGNIIEFINDIAEQTNTLALNASIQAAMAGEQGRGFAVVADEVQRLAERATNATRQIENLVKTIQADTSEAIVSMERSTANVVVGAKSAEEAGQSLTQIESSSLQLSKLITEISGSAREQSAQTNKIAGTMQLIRDIAVQTSGSAAQTARAVGELNTMSEKLRESVSGFRLPEGGSTA